MHIATKLICAGIHECVNNSQFQDLIMYSSTRQCVVHGQTFTCNLLPLFDSNACGSLNASL